MKMTLFRPSGSFRNGFGALYARMDEHRFARQAVTATITFLTVLLAYSAWIHSPTLNEPAHLAAGVSCWRFNRFDLYCVNPPLVRMVAAVPLFVAGYEEDWHNFYKGTGVRAEFNVGNDFVTANGERSLWLVTLARWTCIPFAWVGAIVCFLWARDLFGRPAGVLACILWCFEPNILAHSCLITSDAHASALALAAGYTFWRWLRGPSWTNTILNGIALGVAALSKTTLILFYPALPVLWLVYRWPERTRMYGHDWIRQGTRLAGVLIIGLYVLNLGYNFEGSFTSLKDFDFVSNLFTGREEKSTGNVGHYPLSPIESYHNRFTACWLGKLPMPFPKHYLIGIDLQQRDFEEFREPSYLRGVFRVRGWWYYYIYALAIKIPTGILMLGLTTLLTKSIRPMSMASWRDELVLLALPLLIFAVASLQNTFSHHFRYVLPTVPFCLIWISQLIQILDTHDARSGNADHKSSVPRNRTNSSLHGHDISRMMAAPVIVFVVWAICSTLWSFPHSLSYFNELVQGPRNGSKHLLGSNIDWGQDLLYLKSWMKKLPDERTMYLAYYGGFDPAIVGFSSTEPISENNFGSHVADGQFGFPSPMIPGWYAISNNLLCGSSYEARDGSRAEPKVPDRILEHLRSIEPAHYCGYSILIFDVH